MKLSKYLRPGSIVIGLKADTKWDAIDALLALLERQSLLDDAAQVRVDVVSREEKMSTGIEYGLAIPHAKSIGARDLLMALGIAPDGIDFGSLDGKPAQAIFLVVSRKDTTGPHIQCLAEITARYGRAAVRARLLSARTPQEALQALGMPQAGPERALRT